MGLFDFFTKDVETKDSHHRPELKTHYYKAEYEQVKEAVLRYLREQKARIVNIDDTYGEILVSNPKYDLIISIKKVTVIQNAVDFKLNMKGLIGANRPYHLIKSFYDFLDKQLMLAGVGLN